MHQQARSDAWHWYSKRQQIDAELAHYHAVLEQNQATMTSDLLDNEGFPRAELDIPTIREARHRIQRLRNDRREVDSRLAMLLTHALPPSSVPRQEAVAVAQSDGVRARRMAVRSVSANGPADKAGLCAGDELVRWGPWDPMTTEYMSDLATTVKEGASIPIVVRRTCLDGRTIDVSLTLTPSRWDGRGLLGCHLVPI
ncbi:putative 26S proteasome regulatory subunit [Malassezia nana]|uniref:Probable 26S proteasome regulatory subunit p27 n=1 Tax=Malassezia nana TaxID=180528 RepID=A0AAF0EP59_9BASI|nr:putative 26S proteasome regulatory subunit [Malassezia nana]